MGLLFSPFSLLVNLTVQKSRPFRILLSRSLIHFLNSKHHENKLIAAHGRPRTCTGYPICGQSRHQDHFQKLHFCSVRGSPSQHSMSTEFFKINWSNKHIRNKNISSKLFNIGTFSQQTLLFIVDGIIYTENIKSSCFL